jgi:site-specific DNA-methyltransferase (adenine-specific)
MLDLNKIILGDCAKILKTFPDNCIDLTVTSPPYDNLRTYKGYVFDFETIAKELYRVTKQGGVVVWVVNDETKNGSESLTSCKQKIFFREQCGFNIHDTIIYEKTNFANPSIRRYHQVFEYVFILTKYGGSVCVSPKTFNPIKDKLNIERGKTNWGVNTQRQKNGEMKSKKKSVYREFGMRGNVWLTKTSAQENPCQKNPHPATFPEQLAKDHIYSWSNEGDVVLDPMCGSGTTCKSALQMNRNYIRIEIAKEYHELSVKRVNDYKSQMKMEFKKVI